MVSPYRGVYSHSYIPHYPHRVHIASPDTFRGIGETKHDYGKGSPQNMSKITAEAIALCDEFASDHPGVGLRELQEYVMHQTGLQFQAVRKARKQSNVSLIRKGKNWCCWLSDLEVYEQGWTRITAMLSEQEWQKIMNNFRKGLVEFVVVPAGAQVTVDGAST